MKIILSREYLSLILGVAVVGLGSGATVPLTAIALTQAGYGSAVVGLLTAAQALGGLSAVPLCGWFSTRFGTRQAIMGVVVTIAVATALMQLSTNLWVWAVLRMVCGAMITLLFTIGEAWVNELADDESRGRVVAVYATTLTLFQVAGPVLVSQIYRYTAWRFVLCGAIFLAAVPLLAAMRSNPQGADMHESHGSWRRVLPRMPAIMAAFGFVALFDTLTLSLMPLFAIGHGIESEVALLFASAILFGSMTMQFPIGWLADKLGRERVHALAGVVLVVLLPLLPFAMGTPWLRWPLLFVLGAAAGSIYTLALVACGERFTGAALVSASALASAAWMAASFVGPIVTGELMERAGEDALLWVLFAGALAFLGVLRWERVRGIARPRERA